VDQNGGGDQSLPELSLLGAARLRSSLRMKKKGEQVYGVLTEGGNRWFDTELRSAVERRKWR
jgi:hypothetical protein